MKNNIYTNNSHLLYQEFQKIKKIIESAESLDKWSGDERKWLNLYYKQTYFGNKKLYNGTDTIRPFCQSWVDKWVNANNLENARPMWWDLIKSWFRGCYKQRKNFIKMFYAVYGEIVQILDDMDGGVNQEETLPVRTIGFGK